MFGLLIPHRPIQPGPHQALSETQYAFTVPASPHFSHLAVFLLPEQALPPDTLAAIYIKLPPTPSQPAPEFRLLGALAMDNQSSVFRLLGGADAGSASQAQEQGVVLSSGVREESMMGDETGEPSADGTSVTADSSVVIGISIEPTAQVQQQLASLRNTAPSLSKDGSGAGSEQTTMPTPRVIKSIAEPVGQNAYNFLAGFAQGPTGNESVPLKGLQEWWTRFEKKVELDVGFLMREGAG